MMSGSDKSNFGDQKAVRKSKENFIRGQKNVEKLDKLQNQETKSLHTNVAYIEGSKNEYLPLNEARKEARSITHEMKNDYSLEIDEIELQTAFRNYAVHNVEGIVEAGTNLSSEDRTPWINDRLHKLNKTAGIPGMEDVAKYLNDDYSEKTQQGAEFELDWIAAHADQVESVALITIDPFDGSGMPKSEKQSFDLKLRDGTYVELKSYNFSIPSYETGVGVESVLNQLKGDIEKGAKKIKVIFNPSFGEMPEKFKKRLSQKIKELKRDSKVDIKLNPRGKI